LAFFIDAGFEPCAGVNGVDETCKQIRMDAQRQDEKNKWKKND